MTLASEWQDTTIEALATVSRGASPRPIASTRWFDSKSDVRWVRIADVNRSDGRTLRKTTQALSPDGVARSRLLEPGTLIMSIAATVGIPVITGVPACIHDGFVALENLKADKRFLLYLLKASERRLRDAGQSGSQMNINADIVRGLSVRIPADRAEQKRVAAALWAVDDQIAGLERLITKKRSIEQGMMQQLLTGRTRLPGFDRPWSESSIGELAQIVSGGTPKSSVSNYWDGGVAWCTPTDITRQKGRFLCTTERTISQEGLEHSAAQLLPVGSLLLCTRATIGEVKIATRPIATNQGFKSLVPRTRVSGEYLYYKILTLKDDLAAKGTGSTFLEVSKRDVAALTFEVPGYDEQIAIASALSDADDELTFLQKRLVKARAIKQGLMQELLTGRTRLPMEATP